MPKWGLSMKEGTLNDWLVEEGDQISVGDEVMEVETDKIANVVEAADPGLLRRRVATVGEVYPVRALLGVLAPEDVSDSEVDAFIEAYEVPQRENEDDLNTEPQYDFVDTSAGRLRYALRGSEGPNILLIHGFGGDLDNWLFNIDALAEKAKVYALDLPGHGQSGKHLSDPGLPSLASAVAAFMDAVGLKAAHLVGHSLGAAVAMTMTSASSDRVLSLTLIGGMGFGAEINSDYIDGFVASTSRRELKPVLRHLFADASLVNRAMVDDLLKYKRLDGVRETLTQLAAGLFVNGAQKTNLVEKISAMGVKTLVIWGVEDQVIPVSHAENFPAADVEIIENAGHMVQMEQAGKLNQLVSSHIVGAV